MFSEIVVVRKQSQTLVNVTVHRSDVAKRTVHAHRADRGSGCAGWRSRIHVFDVSERPRSLFDAFIPTKYGRTINHIDGFNTLVSELKLVVNANKPPTTHQHAHFAMVPVTFSNVLLDVDPR